mmetsp:Transcript_7404/g.16268  ORF Transcript_7404/g.16268 Transcript_7404/m.16268 type:complete len:704 (+) Transcript_7404:40-2151(+)|eukprot:CAMPEP_0178450740 /NCGR_PEP_ID=MMETSP0689_2-20121128/43291_1 /TAXON_ID=160604 /ORGANISM="Amphidinium massartii, Strain CS-259" /LENGTH=703 /DNA_ID=CAMNT_0020076237 /DNA_START=21 /DNA_END=2132 /DNA_ORIENTATION=+
MHPPAEAKVEISHTVAQVFYSSGKEDVKDVTSDVFIMAVQDMCAGLHSQVRLARHSFRLLGLSPHCLDLAATALKNLDDAIETSGRELCSIYVAPELHTASGGAAGTGVNLLKLPTTTNSTYPSIEESEFTVDPLPLTSFPANSLHPNARGAISTSAAVPTRTYTVSDVADLDKANEESLGMWVDGVLNPNWPGRLAWDMGVILLVVIDAMVLPFQLAYKEEDPPDFFDTFWQWVTTSFFTVDIILSFMTAYQAGENDELVEPGSLVKSKARIARNYLRTWFPIDIASTIPWGYIATAITPPDSEGNSSSAGQMAKLTKIVKFVRFLRLMRMLRLAKLAQIWERVEANLGSVILRQSVALMRVMCVLVVICHWNACIWWMLGKPESMLTELLTEKNKERFSNLPHWTTMLRGSGDDSYTWLERPRTEQYVFCFYWTLGVMRTMPSEVTPVNLVERVYVMIFMFFAFSAFAICVALITQTFFKFADRKRAFDDNMACVRMHMRDNRISNTVQTVVKNYLRHLYDKRCIEAKEVPMLDRLPKSVQSMMKFEKLNLKLSELRLWSSIGPTAQRYVCQVADPEHMHQGGRLTAQGHPADACYILVSGRLVAEDGRKGNPVKIVDQETLESEHEVLCKKTLRAAACCELIRISKKDFFEAMKKSNQLAGQSQSDSQAVTSTAPDALLRRGSTGGQPVVEAATVAAVIN